MFLLSCLKTAQKRQTVDTLNQRPTYAPVESGLAWILSTSPFVYRPWGLLN